MMGVNRATIAAFVALAFSVSVAQARDLRLADAQPPGSPTVEAANYVSKVIRERTDGRQSIEIRQADRLTRFTTNSLAFQIRNPSTGATNALQYVYDPATQVLTRLLNGESKVFLTGCTYVQFAIYQRNPVNGAYDQYPVSDPSRPDLCKLVQLNWSCSRTILGQAVNSESVQSAKVVMRRP